MCFTMTTYNESQTFCEIENFILSILANQISIDQFKQKIIPLIKKSRRFFIDGNNYIAAIIVFKHLEQIVFKARAFNFYESIQDLPEHVIEQFIQYVKDQSSLIEADYRKDQEQHNAQQKKVERFLSAGIQQHGQLMIYPIQLSVKLEAVSINRMIDLDIYFSAFLKQIRLREQALFHHIRSVIWQMKHDPEQGYYVQLFCIYEGQPHKAVLTNLVQKLAEQWVDISNGYGAVHFDENDEKGIFVNCHDDQRIERALQRVKARLNQHAKDHYLRVMRHRRKTFDCEHIGLREIFL